MRASSYIHGTDPGEQGRLSALNDLINDAGLRELALLGGESIVDLGCGLGQLTRAMARTAGRPAVGIERSAEQRERARQLARDAGEEHLLELRDGDVHAPPLSDREWGSFDLAHARFVLEHVPDPQRVVSAMVRAVRPGGRVVLQDDDHDVLRLWPEPPGFPELWRAYVESYRHHGNDPFVGRRLVSLLHGAGAKPTRCTWIFFGACAGEERFLPLVENTARLLEGAGPSIASARLLGEAELEAGVSALRAWARRPEAAMWFSICWAEGARAR